MLWHKVNVVHVSRHCQGMCIFAYTYIVSSDIELKIVVCIAQYVVCSHINHKSDDSHFDFFMWSGRNHYRRRANILLNITTRAWRWQMSPEAKQRFMNQSCDIPNIQEFYFVLIHALITPLALAMNTVTDNMTIWCCVISECLVFTRGAIQL